MLGFFAFSACGSVLRRGAIQAGKRAGKAQAEIEVIGSGEGEAVAVRTTYAVNVTAAIVFALILRGKV